MADAIDFSASPELPWQRLIDAARAGPPTGLKAMTLATVGLDGSPQARTIVLRQVGQLHQGLAFHADRTSAKVAELRRDPRATLLGWDADARLQLRLTATIDVHLDDDAADQFWQRQSPSSLDVYRHERPSGAEIAWPDEATRAESPRRDRFALLIAKVSAIEWLWLGSDPHRRGRWTIERDGAARHAWLVP